MREAASVPDLHLLGLACAAGFLGRTGRHAGTLAKPRAGLANLQDTAAGERATMLAAHCRRNDPDVAFDAVFPDFETQTRDGDDQR